MSRNALALSLLLHVALFGLGLRWYWSTQARVDGAKQNQALVLARLTVIKPRPQVHINQQQAKVIIHKRHQQKHKHQHAVAAQTRAISGERNVLVERIYAAISAHKTYPEMAQELGQSGKAKVGFDLLPDGEVLQVTLLQSSGFTDLDQAALQAVRAASPIPKLKGLLRKKSHFELGVVFGY